MIVLLLLCKNLVLIDSEFFNAPVSIRFLIPLPLALPPLLTYGYFGLNGPQTAASIASFRAGYDPSDPWSQAKNLNPAVLPALTIE